MNPQNAIYIQHVRKIKTNFTHIIFYNGNQVDKARKNVAFGWVERRNSFPIILLYYVCEWAKNYAAKQTIWKFYQ